MVLTQWVFTVVIVALDVFTGVIHGIILDAFGCGNGDPARILDVVMVILDVFWIW